METPVSFANLVRQLTMLPGVGEKTAERYVYTIYEKENDEIEELVNAIINFKKNIKKCRVCGCISDTEICSVCSNENRDKKTICIVEDSKNVFFIEKTKKYNGLYHVLDGLISPIDGIEPENLNIPTLINDRIKGDINEIIIALNPSIEGEVTSLYLQKILEGNNIKVSRLSYGIPMGSDMEYLDPIMVSKAWDDRKVISNK